MKKFKIAKSPGDKRGWYICLGRSQYLNKDGTITFGIKDEEKSFWKTKEDAEKFIDEWENGGWYQVSSEDELSIGSHYFWWFEGDDDEDVYLAEFDGDGFSCEQCSLIIEDGSDFSTMWVKDFTWPKPPTIKGASK